MYPGVPFVLELRPAHSDTVRIDVPRRGRVCWTTRRYHSRVGRGTPIAGHNALPRAKLRQKIIPSWAWTFRSSHHRKTEGC
jgi:hypothetical protein